MRILITLGLFFLVNGLYAQKLEHRLGYLIVQTRPGYEAAEIVKKHSNRFRSAVQVEKTISKRLDIHLVQFDHASIHEGQLLEALRNDRGIAVAQFDHFTTHRAIPNDSLFSDQWQWINTGQTGGEFNADIDADAAWDITTGGVTPMGDTIVVAIIDDGINYNHPDIAGNVWKNYAEIPENGQDDDDNGYVDDYYGWNAYNDGPDVLSSGHGLQVAGMIGAVGNNTTGITGINWNVKMMTIVGGSPESSVIASYSYALDQRIRYNETNGEEGAFVVATNSSWGIDFGQPDEAPLWCGFYDLLGEHGILSAAATSNVPYDVDSLLDLPTACPSDFLFSVTSLNDENERRGAWGKNHIDFGAPGSNIFTTRGDNGYGNSSGTSFASPITAGMVALLYSAPCLRVSELARQNPANAAKYVRELIFKGVKSIPELEDQTRFGGSLNAANSMALLMSACVECPTPFEIAVDVLSDEDVNIAWIMLDTADVINLRFRPVDSTTWDTIEDVSSPFHLQGLTGCTEYIVEFESICADTSTGFIVSQQFETEGCCELPANISVTTTETSLHASWDTVYAADYFLVQWRLQGQTEWLEEVTSLNEVNINNLQACSFYEFRLQTNCDTSETGFSNIITLRTRGCGNCIDLPYCEGGSESTEDEFIDSLIIGPLVNHSGNDGGYAIFESPAAEFLAGESYDVFLKPGFTGNAFTEQIRIWIDFNQDGVFDDEELVLDTVFLEDPAGLFSEIEIPADALAGDTRMRVSMGGFPSVFDQDPCEIISLGEVEDYCVVIVRDNEICLPVDTVRFDAVTKTSAFMFWPSAEGAIAYTYIYNEQGTTEITELATVDTTANLSGLKECTTYEVVIRTVCLGDTTSYSLPYRFETVCDVAVNEAESLLAVFDVFPNPANDYTIVRVQSKESGNYNITILNMQGQRFLHEEIYAEANQQMQVEIEEIQHFPQGLYLVAIEKDGATEMRKLVKI